MIVVNDMPQVMLLEYEEAICMSSRANANKNEYQPIIKREVLPRDDLPVAIKFYMHKATGIETDRPGAHRLDLKGQGVSLSIGQNIDIGHIACQCSGDDASPPEFRDNQALPDLTSKLRLEAARHYASRRWRAWFVNGFGDSAHRVIFSTSP